VSGFWASKCGMSLTDLCKEENRESNRKTNIGVWRSPVGQCSFG